MKLDDHMVAFFADLPWPAPAPPPPRFELEIAFDGLRLRLARGEGDHELSITTPLGVNHFDLVKALAGLAEGWSEMNGAEPGTWPTGIRAEVLKRIDLKTAAEWFYRIQILVTLAQTDGGR